MFKKTTLAFALLLTAGLAQAAPPAVITYGGFLLDGAGAPVTAPTSVTFRFYTSATGGTALASQNLTVLPSSEGYFSQVLGSGVTGFDALFQSPSVYMGVQVESDTAEMSPRIQITSVPSALSVDWTGITGRPTSSCSGATPVVTGIDVDGRVTCGAAAGAVTSVATGSGLTGGPITTTGTIGIATGGVTSAMIADGTISFADLGQNLCTSGQVLQWSGSAWGCTTVSSSGGTVTSVTAAAGTPISVATGTTTPVLSMSAATSSANGYLSSSDWTTFNGKLSTISVQSTLSGTGASTSPLGIANNAITFGHWAQNGCSFNQVPKWNGSAWACSNDADAGGTVTSVTVAAGTPIGVATGTSTPVLSMNAANSLNNGYLSSTDWNSFNGKLSTVSVQGAITGSGTGASPLAIATGGINSGMIADGTISFADLGQNGCATGQVPQWNSNAWVCQTISGGGGGTVTSVSAAAGTPITVSLGTTTPLLSMVAASSSANGYLSSADWSTFNGKLSSVIHDSSVTGTGTSSSILGIATGGVTFSHLATTGCSNGQVLKIAGTAWGCAADADTNSGGTVTSITANSGLSGGTITGSGTIGIATDGVTSAMIANGTVAFADWASNGCTPGQVPQFAGGGSWTCGTIASSGGTVTSVGTGSGLTGGPITSSGTISIATGGVTFAHWNQNSCATGQVPKWGGATGWACGNDIDTDTNSGGTVTSVSPAAGTPITVATGTTTPVLSMSAATSLANGYLTSADWSTFNGKLSSVSHGTSLTGSGTTASGLDIATGGVTFSHLAQNGCAGGQIPKWDGVALKWACSNDADTNSGGTVTSITAGSGLSGGTITGTGTVAIATGGVTFAHWNQNSCATGQVPKWGGATGWACGNDIDTDTNSGGTVTAITAGSGLTGGTITGAGTIALDSAASPTFAGLTLTGRLNVGWERVSSAVVQMTSSAAASSANFNLQAAYYGVASATCSLGNQIIGGGCSISGTIAGANLFYSYPLSSSWSCMANAEDNSHTLVAYAICARIF